MKKIFIGLFSIFILASMDGCSIIGYNIGKAVDSNNPLIETNTVNPDTLLIGQEILIELQDKRIIPGRFLGIRQSDTGEDFFMMLVKEDSTEFQYDSINRIMEISIKKSTSGRLMGFSLGLAVDAILLSTYVKFPDYSFNLSGVSP
jgi:hypothetical protein